MLAECRECGQPVANRAKTCPNCGVKKPTATKAEAGLDAFAAGAFQLGLLLIVLAVVVVACIAVVACSGPAALNVDEDFERRQAEAGYDPQGRPLPDTRPVYCADYDTWTTADAEMDALEARHGPDTSTWAADDVDALFAAMDRRAAAVERVWAQAPNSATITSVRTACTK